MESQAALGLIKALQIPVTLLSMLNLNGPLFPPERKVKNNTCFDHIIIGGGTAGCILGNRLSKNSSNKVLILEAGGNPPITSFLPPLFVTFPQSKFDWNFTSTFDNYAANSQNNYTKLTAGKLLGGTSSISHFIYVTGAPRDYDNWAKITGDETWNYENVLPYFKKAEKLEDPEILKSKYKKFHGLKGPLATTRLAKKQAVKYIEAFNETGTRAPLDINTDSALGYVQSLFTVSNKGVRQSTAYTHLTPVRKRRNLYVLRYTTAIRIIFDGKKAVAVVAVRKGKIYVYRASKEIIVCAGVYNSPKLLLLSGVGPQEHLESLNIPVVANLPVGKNFQDQVSVSILYRVALNLLPPPLTTIQLNNVPFPVLAGLKALDPKQPYGDYLTFPLVLAHDTPFLILACAVVFQFRPEICDKFNNQVILHDSLYTLLAKSQPNSCGCVELNSTDYHDKPLITTGYFQNKTDLEDMVKYIKDFINVGNSTYFKKVKAKLIDPKLKECSNYTFGTDEYWRCYVLHNAGSVYHSSGTCRMGSVVDSKFRVYNVTNLRVVDASAMPTLTTGGPLATVIMMAEKASDMIIQDADKNPTCKQLYGDQSKKRKTNKQRRKGQKVPHRG